MITNLEARWRMGVRLRGSVERAEVEVELSQWREESVLDSYCVLEK